ncbi:MAG: preprotein translocase subunit SecA [Verrucomicrobia bacterium]|nr:preprotein translocase subunit SecA [Verrucomicrobiota bacterium]
MTPTDEIIRTRLVTPPPLHRGLDGWIHGLIGRWRARHYTRPDFAAAAQRLSEAHAALAEFSDEALQAELDRHRLAVRRHRHNCLAAASAALPVVAEVARRELQLDPYPVQFRGALAILHGTVAEMATGEGKTLTIALAAVPLGWTQLPVHVLTANDYLAERDARKLARFYRRCGLETSRVVADTPPPERAGNHAAAVVYTTGKELLADFLRDRLILGPWQDATLRLARRHFRRPLPATGRLVLRGLHHAIIDEADSLMIDEAVTPLIISRPVDNQAMVDAVLAARAIAIELSEDTDYTVDERHREAALTPAGIARAATRAAELDSAVMEHPHWRREMVETALRAARFFLRDKQYVVQDGAILIVDEFTGRLMPGRQWQQGLHQAVEAKEGLTVNRPAESIAQLSFQTFFRFFHHVGGITGTARECAREIWAVHQRPFVVIPRHRPDRAQRHRPRVFATAAEKWAAVTEAIAAAHATGRPVLVGTRSIAASEKLSARLTRKLVPHKLLNAVRHQEEAEIVAEAGRRGAVTIATNMAGRGTDIRLGGDVVALGGLLVIATEPHRSGRVDRQLFGRAARQGDPGAGALFISCEDELIVDYIPALVRRALQALLAHRSPGAQAAGLAAFRRAQRRAEAVAFRQRVAVLRQDQWIQENLNAGRSDFGF